MESSHGPKVNPIGIRLGIVRDWHSKWYAKKNYAFFAQSRYKLKKLAEKKLASAAISQIHIARPANDAVVTIHAARPGVIIGKKGGGMDALRQEISGILGVSVRLSIEEVKNLN